MRNDEEALNKKKMDILFYDLPFFFFSFNIFILYF